MVISGDQTAKKLSPLPKRGQIKARVVGKILTSVIMVASSNSPVQPTQMVISRDQTTMKNHRPKRGQIKAKVLEKIFQSAIMVASSTGDAVGVMNCCSYASQDFSIRDQREVLKLVN